MIIASIILKDNKNNSNYPNKIKKNINFHFKKYNYDNNVGRCDKYINYNAKYIKFFEQRLNNEKEPIIFNNESTSNLAYKNKQFNDNSNIDAVNNNFNFNNIKLPSNPSNNKLYNLNSHELYNNTDPNAMVEITLLESEEELNNDKTSVRAFDKTFDKSCRKKFVENILKIMINFLIKTVIKIMIYI